MAKALVTRPVKIIREHMEWIVFLGGLIVMASMDPATKAETLCLFERAGISFCPGHGLGHSIAFLFRGELQQAISAHFMGPAAVLILSGRIIWIWKNKLTTHKKQLTEHSDG